MQKVSAQESMIMNSGTAEAKKPGIPGFCITIDGLFHSAAA
jgi:hypothetical protein